jgi:hypothetical protein
VVVAAVQLYCFDTHQQPTTTTVGSKGNLVFWGWGLVLIESCGCDERLQQRSQLQADAPGAASIYQQL